MDKKDRVALSTRAEGSFEVCGHKFNVKSWIFCSSSHFQLHSCECGVGGELALTEAGDLPASAMGE